MKLWSAFLPRDDAGGSKITGCHQDDHGGLQPGGWGGVPSTRGEAGEARLLKRLPGEAPKALHTSLAESKTLGLVGEDHPLLYGEDLGG
jgi:hypothetical protein